MDGQNFLLTNDISCTILGQHSDYKNVPLVITGFDSYNLTTTGGVSMTLQATRADNEHIPCVVLWNGKADGAIGGVFPSQ